MSTTTARPLSFAPPGAAGASVPTPHPRLPGQHFAVALLYFVAGALGLVLIAPDLAAGAFYQPRVAAVVHLFTLGWIMLSIFGALCQFLPVAIGRTLRWERAAHVSFALQGVGVLVFVFSLATGHAHALHLGATLVASAFILFAVNLGATLAQVKERPLTWWALAGASLFLVATPIYGFLLALNLHGGMLGAERFIFVARHVHVAVAGVVLLVMVGVAHRLLPMFLLSHGAAERPAWIAVGLISAGALVLTVPAGGHYAWAFAGACIGAGVVAFLIQSASFYKHSKRKKVDPGMRLAGAGLIGLIGALCIAPFALAKGLENPRLLATYHVVLIGTISLFVAGHYYKIVPFLVWYHRFGPLVGLKKVPKVTDLYSERVASTNGFLLIGGWLGLVAGTFFGLVVLIQAAAVVFALGAIVEMVAIALVAQRKPA